MSYLNFLTASTVLLEDKSPKNKIKTNFNLSNEKKIF